MEMSKRLEKSGEESEAPTTLPGGERGKCVRDTPARLWFRLPFSIELLAASQRWRHRPNHNIPVTRCVR